MPEPTNKSQNTRKYTYHQRESEKSLTCDHRLLSLRSSREARASFHRTVGGTFLECTALCGPYRWRLSCRASTDIPAATAHGARQYECTPGMACSIGRKRSVTTSSARPSCGSVNAKWVTRA
jgi:hypothetical protein